MKTATIASDIETPFACTRSCVVQPVGRAWLFLALAIASEVIGLTVMKATVTRGYCGGYIVLFALIALAYFFLSKAVKKISIGVAYAIWEGSGIALITLVSAVVFHHVLAVREIIGIAMALTGILMVNAGEVHDESRTIPLDDRYDYDGKGSSDD